MTILRRAAREARSAVLRRRSEFTLLPGKDVSAVDASRNLWRSTGSAPSFGLASKHGRLPSGWVRLELTLLVESPASSPPVLYVDRGSGFTESASVPLPWPKDGVVSALLNLTPPVLGLRLAPFDAAGRFSLGAVTLQEIGAVEAGVRMVTPLARRIFNEPGRVRLAFGKAVKTLRKGGLRSLRQEILDRSHRVANGYEVWAEQFDTLRPADVAAIRAQVASLGAAPLLSVVMPVYNPPEKWLRRAIETVRGQLYEKWELCIADDASDAPHVRRVLEEYASRDPRIKVVLRPSNGHISESSNSAIALATGEFLVMMDHDDELPPHALYLVARELERFPGTDLLYSDEDKIDVDGKRYEPYFKPDWDPEMFVCQNYFSHLGVYRTSLVREVGGFRKGYEGSQDYDLALRCTEKTVRVRHLPQVLYHWRAIEGSTARTMSAKGYAQAAAVRALRDHFARVDPRTEVDATPLAAVYRPRRPLPEPPPLVSIIIPTRDGYEILERCIRSIFARTSYPHFELLVVDNQSSEERTLRYLDELAASGRARVLKFDAPFSYSAINNFAVGQARGELICLLNNDVETIGAGWLSELVSQAVRPGVGAVGAKLLYPDGTVQHAGVITGIFGIAGHIYRGLPREAPGDFGRAQMVQSMSAVTAACLCVKRSTWQQLSGLDEEHLAVAFNDVDFCLRLREAGYRNLWTPFAELVHYESYSRGAEDTPMKRQRFEREMAYMHQRWDKCLNHDPAYNPNLSLNSEQFDLAWPPRAPRPWRDIEAGAGDAG